jgi:hypothetical protein
VNQALRSLIGYSGSIVAILATGTVASPDSTQTIPFPEVVNLRKVPTFNAKGIIPQTEIARKNSSKQYLIQQSMDWRNKTPEEVAIDRFGCDCPGCQNRARELMGLAVRG